MIMCTMLYGKQGVWQVNCYALLFVTVQFLWMPYLCHTLKRLWIYVLMFGMLAN